MQHTLGSPRRPRLLVSIGISLAIVLGLSAVAVEGDVRPAAAATADDEAAFAAAINQSRAGAGLHGLSADPAAAQVARAWSGQMASRNQLLHNPNLQGEVERYVTTSWQRIGENVGVGYSVSSLHDAFMNSSGHRANILGDFNRVGVGVVREGSGRIWVTVVFIKGPALQPAYQPFGSFEGASPLPGALRVSGWALDPETSEPIEVHVYVDGGGVNLGRAGGTRPDVAAAFPGFGSGHGFDGVVGVSPGWHWVCAYAINVGWGSNQQLSCKLVIVPADPVGALDRAAQVPGGVQVSGWGIDPETAAPIATHVYVDGRGVNLGSGEVSRPDVGAVFPGYGSAHGFDASVAATPGWHQVCAYGINQGWGANRLLGCKSAFVNPEPFGALDLVTSVAGGIRVSGWALDPETDVPIDVHVYVDADGVSLGGASGSRPDVAAVFGGYGPAHGFDAVVPAAPGWHRVCAYGINQGWGANQLLGCKSVLVS